MSTGEILILLALAVPLFAAAATYGLNKLPDVRETVTVIAGLALITVCAALAMRTGHGTPPQLLVVEPLAGLSLAFRLEPLGAMFALMASVLWAINTLFSIGYMRGRNEAHQTRFYMCFAIAMFAVMGVAMAANLFTLFIFYEVLTLSTYPLVTHKGDEVSRKAGRIYLAILVGASVMLFLPGVIGVHVIAGSTAFVPGGLLAGKIDPVTASALLLLIVFGVAKAALIPVHAWLPKAMVAPTPVSAMLHAVAVVNAGVFTLLKTSSYIFGPNVMSEAPATQWLLWLAAATIVMASLVAMTRDELKARLAWSTIGQLAYVTAGALMAAGAGLVGGGLHMLTHGFGKITLFMCAGAIYVATGVTRVSEMRGLGRRMPVVFVAFLIGALSVTGMPPFAGMWSKFLLITAAFGSGRDVIAWAMIASTILTTLYLIPIAVRGLLPPVGDARPPEFTRPGGAPGLTVAPLVMTAAGTVLLFFLIDEVAAFLIPIAGAAQ